MTLTHCFRWSRLFFRMLSQGERTLLLTKKPVQQHLSTVSARFRQFSQPVVYMFPPLMRVETCNAADRDIDFPENHILSGSEIIEP